MSASAGTRNAPKPVYLVAGEDAALVSQALGELVEELSSTGGGFPAVEEYGEPGRDEPLPLGAVLDACRTPPFLGDRRIVVARAAGVDAAQVKELVAYLEAPVETTVLVLALAGRAAPAALSKAVAARGTVIGAAPGGRPRDRSAWLASHLRAGPVPLDAGAAQRIEEHLGDDLGRLEGLLASLASAYGTDRRLGVAEIEPFLGTAGSVAPWDLTDAIDRGDGPGALAALERLLGGGVRHPLQVLATLQRHYGAMLRLDGANTSDEAGAAALTKLPPYPAKKALAQARRLGHDRIARAVHLLAAADLDLRGKVALPATTVMEILVARLAQLARLPGSARRGAARAPAGAGGRTRGRR